MSLYFNTINRNKQSISVNLKHERGKKIVLDLIKQSDVVVDNFIPGKLEEFGLGYEVFRKANPSIIHASISGYGATGPYAQRAGYDVIAASEAGLLHITGEPDGPPTKLGVGIMDLCTGLYLHGSICAALIARAKTGQGQKIDASLFETTISILNNVGMSWLNLGKEGKRWGTAHPSIVPYDAFKTKDSLLVIGAVNSRQFKTMCKYIGKPELADDPRFVDNDARVNHRVELKEILDALFAAQPTRHWLEVFEKSGLPHGPVNNLEHAFNHSQVAARQMVHCVDHSAAVAGKIKVLGIPVKFSETPGSIRSQPPSLGANTDEVLRELYTEEEIAQMRADGLCATGLGEMAAQAFVQNGARVIIASRKESVLKKTTDRLNSLGPGTCEYIVADLKDKAGCDHLVNEVEKRTDRLTVLVNNTGATWGAPYDDFPESGWDKIMALNVNGLFPSRMSNFGIVKFGDTLLRRQPTGRIGSPSDFAGLVLFLSSLGSAHITGNTIVIDGGSNISGWGSRINQPKI
ncbi:CoA-transferase family III domain-containing protein [Aspergillus floccosus]